jgi:methionine synthase II (cobalamin-independent)
MIYSSISGAYPRIGKEYGQDLRRLWHEYDKGIVTIDRVKESEDEVIRYIVKEQEDAGMDFITDGQVRWNDPVSYIGRKLGFTVGALHHYLDTNFHVRKIYGEYKEWTPLLEEDMSYLRTCTDKFLLAVLPSAQDFIKYSSIKDDTYWRAILDQEEDYLYDFGVDLVFSDGLRPDIYPVTAVDSKNAVMENPKEVALSIHKSIGNVDILLIPSWRLDILPHCYAKQKMVILGHIKEELCKLRQ